MNEHGITKDMFWQRYERELATSIKNDPASYMIKDAAVVAGRMRAHVDTIGKGGGTFNHVSIESPTLKRLAKVYGIKNTYKAWNEFYKNLI